MSHKSRFISQTMQPSEGVFLCYSIDGLHLFWASQDWLVLFYTMLPWPKCMFTVYPMIFDNFLSCSLSSQDVVPVVISSLPPAVHQPLGEMSMTESSRCLKGTILGSSIPPTRRSFCDLLRIKEQMSLQIVPATDGFILC